MGTRTVTAATRMPHLEKGVTDHGFKTSPLLSALASAGCIKSEEEAGPWTGVSWNIDEELASAEVTPVTYGQYDRGNASEPRDVTQVTSEGGQYVMRQQISGLDVKMNKHAKGEDQIIDIKPRVVKTLVKRFTRMFSSELWNGTNLASAGKGGQSMLGWYTALGRVSYTSETLYGLALTTDGWDPTVRLYNSGDTSVWIDDYEEILNEACDAIREKGGNPTHAFARSNVVNGLINNWMKRNATRVERTKLPGVAVGDTRSFRLPTGEILVVDDNAPANTIYIADLPEALELVFGNDNATMKGDERDAIKGLSCEMEWLPRDTEYDDDVMQLRIKTHARLTIRHPELCAIVTTAA